jgi:hypothetical protein
MSEDVSDEAVGIPPNTRETLKQILAHAASQDRTVIEFRTTETASGRRHFSHALDITEHVAELEAQTDDDAHRHPEDRL